MVRSDKTIDQSISQSQQWQQDKLTGNSGGDVDRYQLPANQQARISFSGSERNSVFLKSDENEFINISGISGLDLESDSRCVAIIDLNRDGLNDFLITNSNHATLGIYQNRIGQNTSNNFICVSAVGGNTKNQPNDSYCPRDGTGAIITVKTENRSVIREIRCGEGLATQNSRYQIVGLGNDNKATEISIKWPSGRTDASINVTAGSHITFYENSDELESNNSFVITNYSLDASTTPIASAGPVSFELKIPDSIPLPKQGTVQVLTAMATWCEKCKSHLPEIARIANSLESQIEIVGVPVDSEESKEKLDAYFQQHRPAYRRTELTRGQRNEFVIGVVESLGNANVPFSAIRRSDGTIVSLKSGFPTVSEIRKAMK